MSTSLYRMFQRRGTKSQWETANPVLAVGEIGFSFNENVIKLGDGATAWNFLPSVNGNSAYQVAKVNGYSGTEAQWLASLVGPTGPQGPPGITNAHQSVVTMSTGTEAASTYFSGTAGADEGTGVGAYIESNANAAITAINGVTPTVTQRVLFIARTNSIENGIYTLTNAGSVSAKWRFTRATDYDNATPEDVNSGDFVLITGGTFANKTYIMNAVGTGTNGSIKIGTDNITWTETGGVGPQGLKGDTGDAGPTGPSFITLDSNANTKIGINALSSNTTGSHNIAHGDGALRYNTTGSNNMANGQAALQSNTTGFNNIASGQSALFSNTTGSANIAIGGGALSANTSGINNIAIGTNSLNANSTGEENIAIGTDALLSNTTGVWNVGVGWSTLTSNTDGFANSAFGFATLEGNTSGDNNTAIGADALRLNTTGGSNTAIGSFALTTATTASLNTAVGNSALRVNTTGTQNVAIGAESLMATQTVNDLTAVGYRTLKSNTTGTKNTAVGSTSLENNTTGGSNTSLGYFALKPNTTGANNTAIGADSIFVNTTGNANVAVGARTLLSSNSDGNVAVGYQALLLDTSGANNTAIGNGAGSTITTGSNNTVVGNAAAPVSATTSNSITLGNSSVASLRCQVTTITALSDQRDKKDILDLGYGLNFVNMLRPVEFTWDTRDGLISNKPDIGFIAQELAEVEDSLNDSERLSLTLRDNPEKLEATPGRLLPIAIKAIQELSQQNAELLARVEELEKANLSQG